MADSTDISGFLARIKQDAAFRRALADAAGDEEMLKVIQKGGFSLTAEQLGAALKSWKDASFGGKELSDAQLEAVAGGSIGGFGGKYLGGSTLTTQTSTTLQTQLFTLTYQGATFKGATGL